MYSKSVKQHPSIQTVVYFIFNAYLSPYQPHRLSLRSPRLSVPSDAVVMNHTVPLLDSLVPAET